MAKLKMKKSDHQPTSFARKQLSLKKEFPVNRRWLTFSRTLLIWFCCAILMISYMLCMNEHYSELQKSNYSGVPVSSQIFQTNHSREFTGHIDTVTRSLLPGYPDIPFMMENHGIQIFVHTLLANNVQLKKYDVSWITQLTSDRLDVFIKMLGRWNGPASVTLYCRDLPKDLALIEPIRSRVDFHLVLADLQPGRMYPVNLLRNVAINKCRTNWMVLVDADFIPNEGLYEYLLPRIPSWERGENAVYVLPAFQLQGGAADIPFNKTQLLEMGNKVSPVHPEPGRDIAHKYTNYDKWRSTDEIYETIYQMPYEPYFVTNKRVPRYSTDFMGYGNDKTEHCLEIYKARMKYLVLPYAFVFHVDHPRGEWLQTDTEWVVRGSSTLAKYLVEVQKRYGLSIAGKVQPMAGQPGENCTSVCEQHGLGCRQDYAEPTNTCEAMMAAFGERCQGHCLNNFFGNDLPAYNTDQKACLLNGKLAEYPTVCDVSAAQSARLCPCGDRLPQWLTAEYVVSTLSKEGGWSSVSASLLGKKE